MKQRSDRLPAGKTFPIRGKVLPLLAAPGNAARSPARAGRCLVDQQVREGRRSAPGPAGEKRPPGAGRALAGGFWAPGWSRISVVPWQGRWPLPEIPDIRENVRPGGIRKRDPRFPRPRATVPCRPAGPGTTKGQRPARRARSARRRRGGRWPGAFGPRLVKGQRGAAAGAMAPAKMRKARAGGRGSGPSVRQPMGPARLQRPGNPGAPFGPLAGAVGFPGVLACANPLALRHPPWGRVHFPAV